ncbi:ATP-dependent endonuclease [Streptomyces sp. NPDC001599]|uniref:ATP-dependent nuclease n=1 Tax=Streptomyces sp. NPDC001599 TaxID=3364591 RepID=UPI0036CC2B25
MLKKLRLNHFKGFAEFEINFGQEVVLVGPNNAGKSTIISALRLAAEEVSFARRRNCRDRFDLDGNKWALGHQLSSGIGNPSGFVGENIRHEFRESETRLELTFSSGATLKSVWPVGEFPFFCLVKDDGSLVSTSAVARSVTPSIGVVPTLTPVQHRELILTEKYVRESQTTRLSSSHFRNQLYYLRREDPDAYRDLSDFILDNTPEIQEISIEASSTGDATELDLYFTETATRSVKELFWAGDGLQIWLQFLLHLYRHRAAKTLVLDEPDVFLHPDLQRRLVNVLEERDQQWILATHAPEILAEARRDAVILVDRTRKRARHLRDSKSMEQASQSLGTGFNLGLARALRSKVALFVEGQDMKILRNVARKVGASRLAREKGVAVIPLGGFDKWAQAGSFATLSESLLGDSVKVHVILDRDNRTEGQAFDVTSALSRSGVHCHVWQKKELESYFLIPSVISRLSGADFSLSRDLLAEAISEQKVDAQAQFLYRRQTDLVSASSHAMEVTRAAIPEFDQWWDDEEKRAGMVPPKKVLSSLNVKLMGRGYKAISVRAISNNMRAEEVVPELRDLLLEIESAIAGY